MTIPVPAGPERIVYESRLFEVVKQPMRIGEKVVEFEAARRPPGVRIIVSDGRRILLTREFRHELRQYDYRLPGGKVFDTVAEFRADTQGTLAAAAEAVVRECLEETGIRPLSPRHIHTSVAGGTVIWDLLYFFADAFEDSGQTDDREGEIAGHAWVAVEDVRQMCLDGRISEDRSVAVLLRHILKNE